MAVLSSTHSYSNYRFSSLNFTVVATIATTVGFGFGILFNKLMRFKRDQGFAENQNISHEILKTKSSSLYNRQFNVSFTNCREEFISIALELSKVCDDLCVFLYLILNCLLLIRKYVKI